MENNNFAHLPLTSGIYLFKDISQQIMYIGKAKSIRKRVQTYFNKTMDWKVAALLQEFASIDYIQTKTETEALLLEAQLIKKYQPKYNVLLKSGQPFLYILFGIHARTVELVRNKKKKGIYFGPFLHKRQARSAYRYLMETFQLERCNVKIDGGCLRYHIGLCAGTCRSDFDESIYIFRLELAKSLLQGNYRESLKQLAEQLQNAVNHKQYEKARQLHAFQQHLDVIFETLKTKFSETKYVKDIARVTSPGALPNIKYEALALQVQESLHLQRPVNTIDCFDISHFQSKAIVGSCIRFIDGKPEKNKFRRFLVRTLYEQNDYAALQEIVQRRYKDNHDYPDLILIDGGKGQLSSVLKVIKDKVPVASLAKKEETLFMSYIPHGILLRVHEPVGKLLIALRDYAHHFAITYHRLRRKQL